MPILLAHGELGIYDETVFLGMSIIFVVMIAYSWYRSRGAGEYDFDDALLNQTRDETASKEDDIQPPDRFKLD